MNVKELQAWINSKIKEEHLDLPLLIEDGKGGPITRSTFIMLFINKNARGVTEFEKLSIAKSLGDKDTKRITAVAKVETNGSGWLSNGLPKILYERHYFYRFTKKTIAWLTFGFISNPTSGGYTVDLDKNGIDDNWDKLAAAVCIDPDAAVKSVSIGSFQVMGAWFRECGYDQPIDMLWAARNSEYEHYKMLAGFIKANKLQSKFLMISKNPKDCVPFVAAYNGPNWAKNDYANKLAKAL